jgi:2-keto-4-pentenoate hydratase/2-oxohepta-3-ene-1,7-dioic acid hydratase in catechol pathway
LGLVTGRECSRITAEEATSYVVGVVAVLDQTAEDVLRANPRHLTRSKNYPTFFSFGPEVITLEECSTEPGAWRLRACPPCTTARHAGPTESRE